MAYRWTPSPKLNDRKVEALATSINVSNKIATLLIQRGVETFDEAKQFFRPQLTDLHDPFLMKDMDKAIERIQKALLEKEGTEVRRGTERESSRSKPNPAHCE